MTRGNNHIRSLLAPVSSNVKPHPKRLTTHKSLSRQACGQCSSENDATGSARSRFSSRKEQRPPDIAAELPRRAAADSLATYVARAGSIRETTEGITIMWKKFNVTVLAVLAFGFASALRLNAGTEVVEPYRAPAPSYNYAPPPPVYYAPPVVGVAVYPAFGFGFRGPRFAVFRHHRFFGRRHHWR